MVLAGSLSVQFGAALATELFGRVGPAGAVSLRIALAAILLGGWYLRLAVTGRLGGGGRLGVAGRRLGVGGRRLGTSDLAVVLAFGVVLGAMNLCFYEAIARIPLGVAVTVEFVGPLVLTMVGSRSRLELLWVALAAGGVALLSGHIGHGLDPVGVVLALAAGTCWAAYILASAETGRRFPETSGLAIALVVGAVVVVPFGLAQAGGRLFEPRVLGLGVAVAVLSSVLPYSFELAALRRLSPRAFGILMSVDPAFAALAGLVALGQHLSWVEIGALVLVMVANTGSVLSDGRRH